MFFGINNPECDILAQNIIKDGDAGINFDIVIEKVRYTIKLSVMGEHNIYNALAAITIGLKYNVDIDDIIKGLFEFKSGNMRMDVFESNGVRVINDCYNASPASMEAGIKILKDTKSGNRKIAILGDMFELGEWSLSLHKEVGTFVANNDVDILITVGVNAANIGLGAIEAGMPKEKIMSFNSNSEAIDFIKDFLKQLDIVLIKGSRGMKMEEISMFLRGVA
jgi:UDP-N-acetylmuramoyl-tripeptide--D-alanyl-D-alanine ligase